MFFYASDFFDGPNGLTNQRRSFVNQAGVNLHLIGPSFETGLACWWRSSA